MYKTPFCKSGHIFPLWLLSLCTTIDDEDPPYGATIESHWTYQSQQPTSDPRQASEFFYWSWTSSSTHKTCPKIESGAFVDMVELLPERLDTANSEDAKLKRKKRSLSILEWLQCYAVYVTVVARKQPECLTDLMGYQSLIIEANMKYKNDCWIGYDRRFRQQAASCPHTPWSTIDTTLWNLAFTGHARTTRCKDYEMQVLF